ncbi:hypothetical protein IKL64_06225 [bacterium]|nr:hypothetical protein [bacterium]
MNKWVLSTLIFLILLTTIALSIDTTQNKIISITSQAVKIVNSRSFVTNKTEIKNSQKTPITNEKINIIAQNQKSNKPVELTKEELIEAKFNNILNKKVEVQSIWKQEKEPKIEVKHAKNQKPTHIENQTNKTSTKQPIEKISKQTQPAIVKPAVKKKSIDFSSTNFQTDLRDYILKSIDFPQGYVVNFSFQYTKNGDIAEIHLISIPEKDYLDGDDTYISHIYGDVCKRDNLASNEMYYNNDSLEANLISIPINSTPDGPTLKLFYDTLKGISTNHKIEQVSFEEQDNYNSIGGMYYLGELYLYMN